MKVFERQGSGMIKACSWMGNQTTLQRMNFERRETGVWIITITQVRKLATGVGRVGE